MIFQRFGTIIFPAVFTKYVWVVLLKDKKRVTFVNAFQNILESSKIKPKMILIKLVFKMI